MIKEIKSLDVWYGCVR